VATLPHNLVLRPAGRKTWQSFDDHTTGVVDRALAKFIAATGQDSPPALRNIGILHDVGKLKEIIQKWYHQYCEIIHRIGPPVGAKVAHTLHQKWTKEHKDAEAETDRIVGKRPGHKLEGAAVALEQGWLEEAMIGVGHHGGLPDYHDTGGNKSLHRAFVGKKDVESQEEANKIYKETYRECLAVGRQLLESAGFHLTPHDRPQINIESELILRLMFSCLVDADWEDTEQFNRTQVGDEFDFVPTPLSDLFECRAAIEEYCRKNGHNASKKILRLRETVHRYCVEAATKPQGIFTLNAPVGSGKTVAALLMAILHARAHGLRRIIYVAPYLSIIEQNAEVIREALGLLGVNCYIFEHHSIADPIQGIDPPWQAAAIRARIANWDCSIIITTNVQFFDTLFSNMPGRMRKFHNIANAVVILDEVQNVRPKLIQPTCEMINQIVKVMHTTFILCTATQPEVHVKHVGLTDHLKAHAIIRNPGRLFARAKRVNVTWPIRRTKTGYQWIAWTYEELAKRMGRVRQSYAIVDTRRKARELFAVLHHRVGDAAFHLSTSMNPMHRRFVFHSVLARLAQKMKVRLVGTPCIEAGIDFSFPFGFRELGPYDNDIHASGRCARHGECVGRFVIFMLKDDEGHIITDDNVHTPPDEWYNRGTSVLRQMILAEGPPDINDPAFLRRYYRKLYTEGSLDEHNISELRSKWQFHSVAGFYKTIEDQSRPVVCRTWNCRLGDLGDDRIPDWFHHAGIPIPHPDERMPAIIERIHNELRKRPFNRWLLNLMNYVSANIFWRPFQEFEITGLIETDPETHISFWNGEYDNNVGLVY
jgi:CRISPR-associated endonuclease Cas3-HD